MRMENSLENFTGEFYQMFNKELTSILYNLLQRPVEEHFMIPFMKLLKPKPKALQKKKITYWYPSWTEMQKFLTKY